MGHIQPPIPINIYNTTVVGIVNNTIKQQKSKAFEMGNFWLFDQKAQQIFKFHHHPGKKTSETITQRRLMLHIIKNQTFIHISTQFTQIYDQSIKSD